MSVKDKQNLALLPISVGSQTVVPTVSLPPDPHAPVVSVEEGAAMQPDVSTSPELSDQRMVVFCPENQVLTEANTALTANTPVLSDSATIQRMAEVFKAHFEGTSAFARGSSSSLKAGTSQVSTSFAFGAHASSSQNNSK